MGLVSTMAALVLGLLVSSAKSFYDAQSTELTQVSANVILLDRLLAHYGPETKEARDLLRRTVADGIDMVWPQERAQPSRPEAPPASHEDLIAKIQALSPQDDRQRSIQTQALNTAMGLTQTRWLMYEQEAGSISKPILVILVFWLTAIFVSFGLFAPPNATVMTALFVAGLAVSGAIFLILEMYTPFGGLIEISSAPLRATVKKKFVDERPKSKALFERARKSLLAGVPMNWMVKWAGAFPPFVREAQGAHFFDVDGHRYIDFCLGDTGAMTGHSPFATVKAVEEQSRRGITLMLPGEDSIFVAEELQKRFKLPYWQFALTATDANRFSIRLARQITGRPKILVFNWCYHGTVDETFITLDANGVAGPRPGNIGPPVNPAVTTKVVEFNDVDALEAALVSGDVACVLAEPAMTNVGIVHPQAGYHKALAGTHARVWDAAHYR